MAHTQGKDIILLVDGEAIAACKSNDFTFTADTIEIASSTANCKEFIPSRKSWKATSSHLVARVKDMEALTGKKVYVIIRGREYLEGNTIYRDEMTGYAIVTDCQVSAQNGALCSGSVSLQGTGELTHTANYDYGYTLIITSDDGEGGELPYTLNPGPGHVFDKSLFPKESTTRTYKVNIEVVPTTAPCVSCTPLELNSGQSATLDSLGSNKYTLHAKNGVTGLKLGIDVTPYGTIELEYFIGIT